MVRVSVGQLESFTNNLLKVIGTPQDIAEIVTKSLVNADIKGHSSHGVRQLSAKYDREIKEGKIIPNNYPVTANEGPSWAQIDGNLSFGQAAGELAIESAISKAEKHSIGLIGLNNVSHIGRVGYFAERACQAGFAFIAFVSNPGSAWVAPPGSTQRRFSTNPITIGVPTFNGMPFPLIADLSTSQVAHGKIKERAASGEELPEGWVVGPSGETITDAVAFENEDEGAILPLGGQVSGYKGFGLSLLTELLAANLSDGSVSGMGEVTFGNHVMFVTVNLSEFSSIEQISERAEILSNYVRSTDYSDDIELGAGAYGNETLLPGEAEFRANKRNRKEGVPFSKEDVQNLTDLAQEYDVEESSIPSSFLKS